MASYRPISHQFVLDEAHLSCPICLDYFEEPKSLPNCAHNICKACIQRLDRGTGRIVCPECRVESLIPQSGDFPTNYLLKSLVDGIPGRKESKWLNESLSKHKVRIDTQRKETLENFDVLSRLIEEGLTSHGLKLREQVSKTTIELIDLLRIHEKKLHEKIQQILLEKTNACHAQLEKMQRSFSDRNEIVADKIAYVEEYLASSDSQKIAESKDKLSEDLENLSLGFEEGHLDELVREIFEFKDLKFEKAELADCEILVGTIVDHSRQEVLQRGQHCKSSTKIFLQNLTKLVDVKSLCGLFSPFGKVHCCEIAVNDSGEPLGSGMVHFEQGKSVTTSIKKMDGVLMDDMKLSVGRCISNDKYQSKLSKNLNTNYVYVYYPGDDLTEGHLRSLCGSNDKILSIELLTDGDGKSSLGFVGFWSNKDASQAIEFLNGKLIDDKICIARQVKKKEKILADALSDTRKKKARKSALPRPSISTVYVSNMDAVVNEEILTEEFSAYGAVHGVKIIRNANGRSRGCGFLYFTSEEDAIFAAAMMNGKWLVSRNLVVLYVGKTKGKHLLIKNLEDSIDGAFLRKEFSAFGDVNEVKIMRNDDNSIKGFVTFTTPEEAAIAAAEMNKNILLTKQLSVVVLQSKEERQAQLKVEFSGNQRAKEAST